MLFLDSLFYHYAGGLAWRRLGPLRQCAVLTMTHCWGSAMWFFGLRLHLLALVLLAGLSGVTQAKSVQAYLPWFDSEVETIFDQFDIPGAAVAVVADGKVVYVKTLGVGSIDKRNPVNRHTLFRIASVSKTFTAVLAGLAAQHGQIRWQDPLSRYLSGFRLRNDGSNRLTLRNVLSHTSGLPHNANDNLLEAGQSYATVLGKLQQVNPSCAIGRCFGYQNILYSSMGDVLSKATGRPYTSLLIHQIFRPLGMQDAGSSRWHLLNNPNHAMAHVLGKDGWRVRPVTQPYYEVLPAAGINASIDDMSKYLLAVMGHRPDVIPPKVMAQLTQPIISSPKEGWTSTWRKTRVKRPMYGLGWRIFQYDGKYPMVFHAGGLSGVRARLGFLPKQDVGVVMLWNANDSRPEVLMPMLFDKVLGLPAVQYLDKNSRSLLVRH